MNIAIFRTEQADREQSYNALEYRAAFHGARVVSYVDLDGGDEFRGYPVLGLEQAHAGAFELIVAASPLTPALRVALQSAGWPGERLLSFATDRGECVARWHTSEPGLGWRRMSVRDGELRVHPQHAGLNGPSVSVVPSALSGSAHAALTRRVFEARRRAVRDAPTTGPYVIGDFWNRFMQTTRPAYFEALAREDLPALDVLLASCLRNEMTTGMFSGQKAYEAYDRFVGAGRGAGGRFRQVFNVWRHSVATPDLTRVASPPVGNPYGVLVDGRIVHQNTLLNDFRAEYVRGLVGGLPHPIVAEIGGGYGGFSRQLTANQHNLTYVGFDLPDNLLVASYFLLASHPEKRILLYESAGQALDPHTLRQYDIVLMPNFMLPRLVDRSIDAFVNFISLSEMESETIAEYQEQVERVCDGFFYHENLIESGHNAAHYPVSVFPPLQKFRRICSTPSRWPFFGTASPIHCHGEFLHVRRDVDRRRYFGTPTAAAA